MSARGWSRLALAIFAATLLAEVAAVALSAGLEPAYDTWLYAGYSVALTGAGALVARRHPGNAVGWLLIATGAFNAFVADLAQGYGLRAADQGWPHGPFFEWLSLVNWLVGGALTTMTFLLFPDGRLAGPRWRAVIWVMAVALVLVVPGWMLNADSGTMFVAGTNPYAVDALATRVMYIVGLALFLLATGLSAVSVLARLWRATGDERQQLKLFVYVSAIAVLVLIVGAALWDVFPVFHVTSALALLAMPVAASVAILRYRLYDIDVVINRTLVYGALTVVLGLSYAAVTVLLGTSLGRGSAWVTAAATLVVALAFRPVRARIQDTVDRRFDRRRWDAEHRMDDFLDRLRHGSVAPEEVVPLLRSLVGDESIELAGRSPDIRHAELTLDQESLLTVLLERGALAVQMVGLHAELRNQLVEVEASRARIVEAGDRERRRIERDLHDGAQQRLVSIGLALRHAQHQLASGTGHVDQTLEASVAEIGATIEELRQLTHGLPPSQLDAGLAPAFHELARRSPVPVEVAVVRERFDRGLEAAAYFVGCEALTNAVKHAGATHIDLRARRSNGSLVVQVDDDGTGGADPGSGTGLRGLADRVSALGGTLTIASRPGAGTQLTAELPLQVVIAEDQVLLREGLARLFSDAGHEVVATLSDAEDVLQTVVTEKPDLVVLDVRMPPTHTDEGIRAAAAVKKAYPEVGVLVLSQHVETVHAVSLVHLGGFGYLLKDRVLDVGEFLAAAERVAGGGSALDPHVVGSLVASSGSRDSLSVLTDREREVLELMAEGLTNTGIAQRLWLSERTVEAHVRRLLLKLDLPTDELAHRRVLAVLAHLAAHAPSRAD